MTITYVAAGTVATGNNASITPGLPVGVANDDLLVIVASIRNSGTGTVNTPSGWTQILSFGNVALLGRFYASGVVAPLVTFTGGVANADTQAAMLAFRGVSPDALTASVSATLLNGSAANITYPALDVPGPGEAVVLVAWKQDDSTTLTTPASFTRPVYSSVTTGDDATLAIYYSVQTTEADIVSAALTVTGGAAAISRGIVLALKPAAAIAVTEQNVYPPRVLVTVSGLTVGDSVTIYREVASVRTAVRGASTDAAIDPAFVAVDAELPFGVPVRYVAVVEGAAEYTTTPDTYSLPGGRVAVTDAITGSSAEVTIMAIGDKTYTRDSTRFRVAGRNIVVSGPQAQAEGTYELFTDATSSYDNLMSLLADATEGVVQIRQPGVSALSGEPYDGIDAYLAVDRVTVRRFSQDGSDPRRLTTIEYAETDGWAAVLQARGFTYDDVETFYAGITYASAALDYATYLAAVQGDYS